MTNTHKEPVPDLLRGTLHGRARRVARRILLPTFRLIFGMRLEGVENIPPAGPLIVIANHVHNADPLLLETAMTRPLFFMTKKEAFKYPVISHIARYGGSFPVDRGKPDRAAIRHAENVLAQGIALGMFPEGTRSVTRSMARAMPGAALIAVHSGAPILPVAISGTERLPFNGGKARRRDGLPEPDPGHPGALFHFGRPFTIPREIDGQRIKLDVATDLMMLEIARLLPPDYRGIYADRINEPRLVIPLPSPGEKS